MKKLLGQYFLGNESVRVVIDTTSRDGHAQLPGNWQIAGKMITGCITIGLALEWGSVVGTFLHEAMEYVAVKRECRFVADARFCLSPSHGVFLMTHDQYSEICDQVGMFLSQSLPDLATAHTKYRKAHK
jgi:hypothetical protein